MLGTGEQQGVGRDRVGTAPAVQFLFSQREAERLATACRTPTGGDRNDIGRTDEIGNIGTFRQSVEFFRCSKLGNAALVHQRDFVRHGQGFFLIVCDEHRGDPRFLHQIENDVTHLHAHFGVEVGQGLVHQQNPRTNYQRPRQGNPLSLATAHLRRITFGQVSETDAFQRFHGTGIDFGAGNLAGAQAVGDVLESRFIGKQGVVLKHHADVSVVGGNVRHLVLIEQDASAVGFMETGNTAQQGGLAATARPQQGEKSAVRDVQRQVLKNGVAAKFLP